MGGIDRGVASAKRRTWPAGHEKQPAYWILGRLHQDRKNASTTLRGG